MEGGLFLSAFIATPFICTGTRGWDCVEFVLVIVDVGYYFCGPAALSGLCLHSKLCSK